MMQIVYSKHFFNSAKKLPEILQNKLAKQLELLRQNPFHPLLHSKSLTGQLAGFYSFRITRDWRVIFQFEKADTIKLVEIGNRKDIYK